MCKKHIFSHIMLNPDLPPPHWNDEIRIVGIYSIFIFVLTNSSDRQFFLYFKQHLLWCDNVRYGDHFEKRKYFNGGGEGNL